MLPAVSGEECIAALVASGWRVAERRDGASRLVRGQDVLVIPHDPLLDANWLMALLEAARIGTPAFLDALDRAGART
jgi:hypothetical protein